MEKFLTIAMACTLVFLLFFCTALSNHIDDQEAKIQYLKGLTEGCKK